MPLLLLAPPILFVMRQIAINDDQKFRQLFLSFRTNFLGSGNKLHWKGVSSFGPSIYSDQIKKKLYKK